MASALYLRYETSLLKVLQGVHTYAHQHPTTFPIAKRVYIAIDAQLVPEVSPAHWSTMRARSQPLAPHRKESGLDKREDLRVHFVNRCTKSIH
jgi:hypothetical protein